MSQSEFSKTMSADQIINFLFASTTGNRHFVLSGKEKLGLSLEYGIQNNFYRFSLQEKSV